MSKISKLFSDAGNILEYAGQQGFVPESLGHLVLVHPQGYLGQPGSSFVEIGHQTSGLQHLYHSCKYFGYSQLLVKISSLLTYTGRLVFGFHLTSL